ncbi:hypothetical protein HELRODRAFT_179737 [Helobdella robusta]|uniref:Uncharacterized protein n=1 Tax=Helobdella robusta TaxID=6412 RepID=T1FF34_HELRO|nr:hypothetical protein HELRODRAFT_179737 [Helobdella robusta]ESN95141.1 hypothetical protein HELRODRAFT_179737 [Helobdella robusta]
MSIMIDASSKNDATPRLIAKPSAYQQINDVIQIEFEKFASGSWELGMEEVVEVTGKTTEFVVGAGVGMYMKTERAKQGIIHKACDREPGYCIHRSRLMYHRLFYII